MEIDLYTDLAAFNALTPEEQEEEAQRLRLALEPSEPPKPVLVEVPVAPVSQRPVAEPEPLPTAAVPERPVAAPEPLPTQAVPERPAVATVPLPTPAVPERPSAAPEPLPAPAPQRPPVMPAPPPKPAPRQTMARVMVAPAALFAGQVMADTPGSVILRAEDILPEEDEPEFEPGPEPQDELVAELIPEPVPELIPEPQPVVRPPESIGRKVKMDDQLKVSGPLVDLGIPAKTADSGLIVCPVCSSSSNPQDLFCVGCGSFLNETDAPDVELIGILACTDCNAAVEPGEIFCPSCGSSLPG